MKKSIFLFFAAILCATSAWAANVGFESSGNTMKYYSNLKSSDQTVNLDRTNGTTTSLGAVTALYLKGFACKMYQDADNTIWGGGAQHAYYKIHRTAVAAGTSGYTDVTDWDWNWQNWSSGWRYPTGSKSLDVNLLSGLGSGEYSMTYYFQQKGSSTWRLPSTSSKYNVLTWTINVPDITSAECTSNGTGLGTEVSPFLVPEGDILTLTVKGTQESDDANSELYAQFASNEYSSTLTHNITPTTTVQSITIKVKYYNSADKLSSSNEKTLTIYYKAIQEETHNVTISYQCNGNKIENIEDEIVKVGVSTQSEITAPTIAGYTFSSWEPRDGITQKSVAGNAITIITKTGFNESDYTLVANYNEDLTTGWVLKGSFVDDFATAYDFVKKSGESTSKVAYVSIDLEADKEYHFKVVKDDTWYGNSNNTDGEKWWIKQTTENWTFKSSDGGDCYMKSGLAGTYTFKIDYSGANPQVSVYFPEIYAIVGSFNEWNENTNKLNFDGNIGTATINLEASATNYEFKVIDNAVHGGIVDKTITQTENDLAIIVGGGDNIKLTANANPKGNYIFRYDKSTKKLSVTYPTVYTITVEAENGTVEGAGTYVEGTTVSLTATPAEGYTFKNWTVAGTGTEKSVEAKYTFTVTEPIDLVANFELKTYTVEFLNYDDEVLQSSTVNHGETPEYTGETPTKDADAQYTYAFSGWDPEIAVATSNQTYRAQYTSTVNKYTITFNNWNGTTLATYEVEYGQTPVYAGEAPTKAATAEHTYTFTGWTPAIVAVTGEATYTATYSQTLNQHTIIATATNGTVTGAGTYNYGAEVTLTATPDFDYVFVNWTVGGEVVSTANPYTFQATANIEVVANFQVVAATTAKSGKFSTGKYEYAEFATGNLQYKPSTDTWRFAKQQYQYVGKDNIYVGKEDYKGWIDLFGWSADDKFGVNPSNDNTNYQGEFVDWGTLFPEEGWSTLSKNQWNYLLNKRTDAASLKQIAMIGETLGIMLFPDKWTLPADCEPTKQTHHDEEDGEDHSCDFVSYNYTLAQWAELENAGAIFLPAAGRRTGGWGNQTISPHMTGKAYLDADGHYKHYADYYAYYWTSTKTDGKVNYLINCTLVDKVKDTYTVHAGHVDWAEEARYGQSVRLAKVTSTLIEIGDGDNSKVITENANNRINVQLNRSFTANVGYYTLCLPFDIAADKIGTAYELGTITEYEANGGININLTEVKDIKAGVPYLVLPKTLDNPVFENVTIVDTEGSNYTVTGAGVKVTFAGIINGKGEKTNGETEYYVGNEGKLYNGTVDKLGLRAFFTITDEAGNKVNVRARVVAGENVETGVEDIITTDAPVKVIENGQLIIIRDGVKYNVQGVRL